MFLISFCPQAYAQLDEEKLLQFTWEGVSLSMSPEEVYSSLEGDGYELTRESDNGQIIKSIYKRKTDKTLYTVDINEQDGVVTAIHFYEALSNEEAHRQKTARLVQAKKDKLANGGKKVRRKKNTKKTQNAQALDAKFSRIKSMLDIEDDTCLSKPNIKGGGRCTGAFKSDTHKNSFKLSVLPKATKIFVSSVPLPGKIVERNKKRTQGLDSAYSCFRTTNINSAQEILDCMQSSLSTVGLKKRIPSLDSPNLTCGLMTDYYEKALNHLEEDASLIPDCKTFADVLELSTGKPPVWSECVEPRNDAEFFRNCVTGYSPSLASPKGYKIPSCNSLQNAYKNGIFAAQPNWQLNQKDISLPDCNFMLSAAKTLRRELPASLKGCDGYDPNNTAEHLTECLSSENEIMNLRSCDQVRAAYKRNVTKVNRVEKRSINVPCEETEAVLAKAREIREKRQRAEKEFKRRQAEAKQRENQRKQDIINAKNEAALAKAKEAREIWLKNKQEFNRKQAEAKQKARQQEQDRLNVIKNRMAEKYKDTPEGIKSKTSPLEKRAESGSGAAPTTYPRIDEITVKTGFPPIRIGMSFNEVRAIEKHRQLHLPFVNTIFVGTQMYRVDNFFGGPALVSYEFHADKLTKWGYLRKISTSDQQDQLFTNWFRSLRILCAGGVIPPQIKKKKNGVTLIQRFRDKNNVEYELGARNMDTSRNMRQYVYLKIWTSGARR
jgi:hypothetical protein